MNYTIATLLLVSCMGTHNHLLCFGPKQPTKIYNKDLFQVSYHRGGGGGGMGTPKKKRTGVLNLYLLGAKKWFWYLLGLSALKAPQLELLQYLHVMGN